MDWEQPSLAGNTYNFCIGGLCYGNEKFQGDIGEFLMYNEALSDQAVGDVMNSLAVKWLGETNVCAYSVCGICHSCTITGRCEIVSGDSCDDGNSITAGDTCRDSGECIGEGKTIITESEVVVAMV